MTPSSLKLPLRFDAEKLERDLRQMLANEFIPHFNTRYYEGDWSVVPLRSVGGGCRMNRSPPVMSRSLAASGGTIIRSPSRRSRSRDAFTSTRSHPAPRSGLRSSRFCLSNKMTSRRTRGRSSRGGTTGGT